MKSTGIVRRLDDLGRITLPVELRRVLGIEPRDAVEIYMDNEKIVLKKYVSTAVDEEKEAALKELQQLAAEVDEKTHSILTNAMRLIKQK